MYLPALQLCLDLEFLDQNVTLLNAVEFMFSEAPAFDGVASSDEWMERLREAGRAAVSKASALPESRDIPCKSLVVDGSAVATLMNYADANEIDLITIGSTNPGRLAAFFLGSVARGLAIGAKQSILVTKHDHIISTPIRAVFATDGSPYADRALERFLSWAPKGIEKVDVVRAYEIAEFTHGFDRKFFVEEIGDSADAIEAHLTELCETKCARLRNAGYGSKPLVHEGHPNKILPQTMAQNGANLLIMGAQGHGFLERLFVGSVALGQVTSQPYPVLLVRA